MTKPANEDQLVAHVNVDQNYWEKVETYFTQHSNVAFTHSYCPNCYERFVRPELDALEDAKAAQDRRRGNS